MVNTIFKKMHKILEANNRNMVLLIKFHRHLPQLLKHTNLCTIIVLGMLFLIYTDN